MSKKDMEKTSGGIAFAAVWLLSLATIQVLTGAYKVITSDNGEINVMDATGKSGAAKWENNPDPSSKDFSRPFIYSA